MAGTLCCAPSWAQDKPIMPTIPETQIEPRTVATPFEFVSAASSADEFEIKAAQIALQKAQLPEVKAFAQMMIDDHTKSTVALMSAAKSDNVDIAAPSPDGEQQGMLGKLEQANAPDFDRVYVETQVFVHQRALSLFRGYSEGDAALNRFAMGTLPVLTSHYNAITELAGKVEAESAVQ